MMLGLQILAALCLDQILGDPRWLPHPVRGIGRLAQWTEPFARARIRQPKLAGILAVSIVVAVPVLLVWLILWTALHIHPWLHATIGTYIIYTTIAPRDLMRHSIAVFHQLAAGNLPEARRKVACIVGRDTASLDEAGITRATIETVAESTVDGVIAPLFFALLAGPMGAMAYRAINTLDSMYGYKNERYMHFGCAAARLDDIANWLPARLAAPCLVLAAAILPGNHPAKAWRIMRRDGRKHESPNAGWTEAAMAGALDTQLGGTNIYEGAPLPKPTLGEPNRPLALAMIPAANRLMLAATLIFTLAGTTLRFFVSP